MSASASRRRFAARAALRLAAFVAAFSIEIRAKAETAAAPLASLPEARRPADEPRGCARAAPAIACAAIAGPKERVDLALPGGRIALDRGSVAARSGPSKASFVDGQILAETEGALDVATEFGEVRVEAGKAWIARSDGKIWIDAIEGSVAIFPRGGGEPLAVPPGMRNWLGPVGATGKAQFGFPTSIDFRAHLERWARVFPGTKTEFMEQAEALADVWKRAVREVASLDERRARERAAMIAAEDRRRAETASAREARNRGLRALFRRKAFE